MSRCWFLVCFLSFETFYQGWWRVASDLFLCFFALPLGAGRPASLCYFFLCLAKKKVTKKETRPPRTAVLADGKWRSLDSRPPRTLRYALRHGITAEALPRQKGTLQEPVLRRWLPACAFTGSSCARNAQPTLEMGASGNC